MSQTKTDDSAAPQSRSNTRPIAAVVLGLSLLVLFGSGYAWWRSYETPPLDRYAKVLAAFKDHQIPLDDAGRANLSKLFPGITGHDDAYASYRDDGTFIVLFPTYYGQGQEVAGLVYTSRPLTDDDTHDRVSAIHFAQRLIKAGAYDHLLIDQRINENWYHVSYKLH